MFVAECLQFARSHHKVVTLASHVVIVQNIPEDFKVLRFVDSGIFTDLIEIREYAPLTCFVWYIRLFHRVDSCTIIRFTFRLRTCPTKSACAGFHMILIVRLPLPAVSNGGSCVYTTRIGCFPIIHELADPCHPTTGRFIAASQHAVRSVIPIFLGQCNGFVHQVFVNRLSVTQSRTVVRPARSFRLQIETDQIGSDESCFRRTERVEAHVIQAIVTTNAEHPFPGSYIHRRIACQWEVTVFHRTAKHRFATIYIEPFPFYLEITHTELYLLCVSLLAVG